MRTLFWLAVILCGGAGAAVAQTPPGSYGPGPCPFGASSCQVTATTIAASGASQTLRASSWGYYVETLTANVVNTLAAGASGLSQTLSVEMHQVATAGRTPSFSGTIHWQGNIAPTFNAAFGYYDVVAFNTTNGGTTWTGYLVGTFPDVATVPGVPAGVAAQAGNTQNLISANAMAGQPSVTGYTIYRGTTPGGESGSPVATNVPLPYNDTGLSNGTTYYYKIAAVNSQGTGAQSAEVSAATSATAYGHYYTIASTGFFYTPHNAAYSPGSNTFIVECLWSPSSFTPASPMACGGKWPGVIGGDGNGQYLLYLYTNGALGLNWEIAGPTISAALSTVNPAFQSKVPLWVRADVNPVTGLVVFYTAPWNGSSNYASAPWVQLGSTVTGSTPGAVQTPGSPYDLVQAQGSGGGLQFTGDIFAMTLFVNGSVVTCPVAGAASFTDACGSKVYTASGGVFH